MRRVKKNKNKKELCTRGQLLLLFLYDEFLSCALTVSWSFGRIHFQKWGKERLFFLLKIHILCMYLTFTNFFTTFFFQFHQLFFEILRFVFRFTLWTFFLFIYLFRSNLKKHVWQPLSFLLCLLIFRCLY